MQLPKTAFKTFYKKLQKWFPDKTFVITTNESTKYIKITCLMQLAIVFLFSVFVIYGSVKYRISVYHEDKTSLIEENATLKTQNMQLVAYLNDLNGQVDKINEYLNVVDKNKDDKSDKKTKREKIDINNTKEQVQKKMEKTYHALNERKHKLYALAKDVGVQNSNYFSNAVVVKSQKTVDVPVENNTYEKQVSNNEAEATQEVAMGGVFEPTAVERPTKLIKKTITTTSKSFHQKPEINQSNYNRTLTDLIDTEKFASSLPLGVPAKDSYYTTSKFGYRSDPFAKVKAVHRGQDMVISTRKIYAPQDGRVSFRGQKTGYGNVLELDHFKGYDKISTRYAHLAEFKVNQGDRVKKGDLIAIQGSTGRSTRSHLHYEVLINNQQVDPMKFMKAKKV